MPRRTGLLHGGMAGALGKGFFPTTARILEEAGTTQTASGQEVPDPQPLAGHTKVPCTHPAPPKRGTGADELLRTEGDIAEITHRIGLQGHRPAVTELMSAVVGGVTYDIKGVQHDSQLGITYLDTRIVR